ncbi:MAG: mechanosensitive ion channel [Hyphomonadaceae bacterium]|nr:mechanosensitive ion channel [Hyphomonadaceae bacterium]
MSQQAEQETPQTEDQPIPETARPTETAQDIATTPVTETESTGFSIPTSPDEFKEIFANVGGQILDWLQSPAFLAQVGAVVIGYILAKFITRMLLKKIEFFKDEPKDGKFLKLRQIGYSLRDLIFPAVLIALYAVCSPALKGVDVLGQDWLVKIAQGLAVVFLLYTAIKRFIKHPLVQKAVMWIAIPVAMLKVFGKYNAFRSFLQEDALLELGEISIPAWTIINLLIFGAILFWIGRVSNNRGKDAIRSQDSLDVATKEVFAKIFELFVFMVLFVLLMSIAGIPLTSLLLLGGPLMLGIGLGLQPIAANFVSGMILLLDRTLKIGDFVELPDGKQGYVEAMNMRSATIETTDGKDIMVPNVTFIEEAYENWTHKDPRQRYEVYFSVAYDTDLDKLEDIVIPAVSKHPLVLQEPEKPDLELRDFGDFGINFAVEFWVEGIDDGVNKFTSDLNFIIWRTLKKHGVVMPLPQREVRNIK